jgi:hypothetical protein
MKVEMGNAFSMIHDYVWGGGMCTFDGETGSGQHCRSPGRKCIRVDWE